MCGHPLMPDWPKVKTEANEAGRQRGGRVSQWAGRSTTTMPCGEGLSLRVKSGDRARAMLAAEAQLKTQAERHLRDCDKCKEQRR